MKTQFSDSYEGWSFLFGSSIGSLTAFGLMGRWGMGIEAAVLTMIFGALYICWNSRKRLPTGRVIAITDAAGVPPPPPGQLVSVQLGYDNGQCERFAVPVKVEIQGVRDCSNTGVNGTYPLTETAPNCYSNQSPAEAK